MRTLCAFVLHELRMQLRSPAFWIFSLLYVVLSLLPAGAVFVLRDRSRQIIGGASYAAELYRVLPLTTALIAFAFSVGGIQRERDEGSFEVVALSPVGNAGYLFYRWCGLLTLLLPLTAVPVLFAGTFSFLGGAPPDSAGAFVWPWLLHVLPLCVGWSALALGLGTIGRGMLAAVLLTVVIFSLSFSFSNDILAHFGRKLTPPTSWVGSGRGIEALRSLQWIYHGFHVPATEAPVDVRATWAGHVEMGATFLGCSAAVLAFAVLYLRRTRRDVRPWAIPEKHQLRSFLRFGNGVRVGLIPDRRVSVVDRLVVLTGILACASAFAVGLARDQRYRTLAEEKHRVLVSGEPAPMSTAVRPESWGIRATIDADGRVRSRIVAELINHGETAVEELAFSVDPALELLEIHTDDGAAEARGSWDRLSVRLERAFAPGTRRRLELALEGTPKIVKLALPGGGSFVERYERFRRATVASELSDLSRSYELRRVSPVRVELQAADLTPVPRYTPWTLTPPTTEMGRAGREVPPETIEPVTEVSLEIAGPPALADLFLADSCGGSSERTGDGSVLRSRCRLAVSRIAVRGGRLLPIDDAAGIGAFAVLPVHREVARLHLPSLEEAATLAREAWPEIDPFHDSVILEWPPRVRFDPQEGMEPSWWYQIKQAEIETIGAMMLIPESILVGRDALSSAELAAGAIAAELQGRRPIVDRESLFFSEFFRWLAFSRMGPTQDSAMVVPRHGPQPKSLSEPMLGARRWNYVMWQMKLPALMSHVRQLAGDRGFMEGVRDFLEASSDPGTSIELMRRISERGGIDLSGVYESYIVGGAIPLLTLADVRFVRDGRAWIVSGRLVNEGDGPTACPIVLKSDVQDESVLVEIDAGGSSEFRIRSLYQPRTVLLDPDRRCFRMQPKPKGDNVDRVEYSEGS